MTTNLKRILATDGSVVAIRALGLSNAELVQASSEIATMPGYHGRIECEPDAVTGEMLPVRERVTHLRALASAVTQAQR